MEHSNIKWNGRLEDYFSSTGEKAHCYSWAHKRAQKLYSRKTVPLDLIVIVLGSINGAVSIGSESLFGGSGFSSIGVGVIALLCSILTTINSYFSWAKMSESHRIAAIQYSKLYRFISLEMSLPRKERMSPADLLKMTRESVDRLSEISPPIPEEIIAQFQKKFNKIKNVSFPEEFNGLEKIEVYNLSEDIMFSPSRPSPIRQSVSDGGFKISITEPDTSLEGKAVGI